MQPTQQSTPAPQQAVPRQQMRPAAFYSSTSIIDVLYICLAHWMWFILSLIVCLALAKLYILKTPKTYTRTMQILLKEDKNGQSIGTDAAQVFGDMGLASSNTNVYNELHFLKSNDVAKSVAKRLNLNVNYYTDGAFHDNTLYGTNLPVKVDFPGAKDDQFMSLDLVINDSKSCTLSNFNGQGSSQSIKADFGFNMTHTPIGRVVVIKSPYFDVSMAGKTIHIVHTSLDGAKGAVMGRFSADLADKNSSVITMAYVDVSPQRAEDVLNTIISVYNENWVKDRNQIAVSTSDFINDRLDVIERELGSVDNNISTYKSVNGITDIRTNSQMYLQQSTEADAQMLDINNQLYMAKYIRSYLSNKGGAYQLLPANAGIEAGGITSQIQQYNSTLLQRNNIVANSSESNPLVVDLDKQLAALRTAMTHSIDNVIMGLQKRLSTQESVAGEASSKMASSPSQAKHLLSAERQQKVKESLYLFLLQKREENELSQAFTAYNTRIVNAPHGSSAPTYPLTSKIYLIALAIGLGLPFVFLYIREMMNTTVRGKADIDKRVTLPYLGEIPLRFENVKVKNWEFWKKKRQHKNLIVKAGSRGMLNEAFRIVGTNLEFMSGKSEGANVCMVTSYNQGSGKSFTAINLGATLSLKNNRVLVIDGDLRHASVSNYIGKPKKGISDYLSENENNVNDLVVNVEQFENLFVLPVGTIPPNPSELLASERFAEVIETLRPQYDYILIDCPPSDMMADATIVGRNVDRTIFVVRAGLFERNMLDQLEEDYNNGKLKNAAILLNATRGVGGHYGYRYGYHYGYHYGYRYGYHYGYGDKKHDKE